MGSSGLRREEQSAGDQEHVESVVVVVAVAAGDAPVQFDDSVDRFRAAVVGLFTNKGLVGWARR